MSTPSHKTQASRDAFVIKCLLKIPETRTAAQEEEMPLPAVTSMLHDRQPRYRGSVSLRDRKFLLPWKKQDLLSAHSAPAQCVLSWPFPEGQTARAWTWPPTFFLMLSLRAGWALSPLPHTSPWRVEGQLHCTSLHFTSLHFSSLTVNLTQEI
jgi:hypothetical protein